MFAFIAMLVIAIIAIALMPSPKFADPKAGGIADVDVPTVSGAKAITYAPGTNLIQGANCLWFGHMKSEAITDKIKSGFKKIKITLGHKYYLGFVMALCWGPIDALREVRFGNFRAWTGSAGAGSIRIDKPTLFGDKDAEGGVKGYLQIKIGSATQSVSSYFQGRFGAQLPGFRRLAYVTWKRGYIGNQAMLRNPAFVVTMIPRPSGFDTSKATINTFDANPAYILWDALTNPLYGAAIPVSFLDDATFQTVANTLFDENFGLSFAFQQQQNADAFEEEISRHVDGVLYQNPVSGLLSYLLIRDDYDPNTILQLNDQHIRDVKNLKLQSLTGLISEVKVKYVSRNEKYRERIAMAQNSAVQYKLGYPVSRTIDYPGCKRGNVANKIAKRDLEALSSSPISLTLTVDRTAYTLHRGAVFRINSQRYGINNLVCRVQDISFGTLESGTITIKAMQDKFQIDEGLFLDNPAGEFTPIDTLPQQIVDNDVMDMPYFLLDENLGDYQIMALFKAPGESSLTFDMYSRIGGAGLFTADGIQTGYIKFEELREALTQFDTVVELANEFPNLEEDSLEGIRQYGSNMLLIGDPEGLHEICCFQQFTFVDIEDDERTQYTGVQRGLLDTVPRDWPVGTDVYYLGEGDWGGSDRDDYTLNDAFNLRPVDNAFGGQFDQATATIKIHTIGPRPDLPYPVARVTVEGDPEPLDPIEYKSGVGGLDFAWFERNRLTSTIQFQNEATEVPEASTTYELRVYADGTDIDIGIAEEFDTGAGSFFFFDNLISGTSYTMSEDDVRTELPFLFRELQVQLKTVQGGQNSFTDYYLNFRHDPPPTKSFNYFNETAQLLPQYWIEMGDNSGTTAVDRSGNAFDMTYVNSPSLNRAERAYTQFDNSVLFDGVDQCINTNQTSDSFDSSVFVDLFFRMDVSVAADNLVAQRFFTAYSNDAAGTQCLAFGINQNKIAILTRENDNTETVHEGTTTLAIETWYHVRFYHDATNNRIIAWLVTDLDDGRNESNITEEIYVELTNPLDPFSTTDNAFLFGDHLNTTRYFDGHAQGVVICTTENKGFFSRVKTLEGGARVDAGFDRYDPRNVGPGYGESASMEDAFTSFYNAGTGDEVTAQMSHKMLGPGFYAMEFDTSNDTWGRIGVVAEGADLTAELGHDTLGWALDYNTGGVWNNGVSDLQANDADVAGIVMVQITSANAQHVVKWIANDAEIATVTIDADTHPIIYFASSMDAVGHRIGTDSGDIGDGQYDNIAALTPAVTGQIGGSRPKPASYTDFSGMGTRIDTRHVGHFESVSMKTVSGEAQGNSGFGGKLIGVFEDCTLPEQYSEATIGSLPVTNPGVFMNGPGVRHVWKNTSLNTGYFYALQTDGAVDLMYIDEFDAIIQLVAGTASEASATDVLRIEATNDYDTDDVTLKCYINGTLKITHVDSTYQQLGGVPSLIMVSNLDGGFSDWKYGSMFEGEF